MRPAALALIAGALVPAGVSEGGRPARPNVVILADDQGWGDLSLNGDSNLRTPHIDSLARDGARPRLTELRMRRRRLCVVSWWPCGPSSP